MVRRGINVERKGENAKCRVIGMSEAPVEQQQQQQQKRQQGNKRGLRATACGEEWGYRPLEDEDVQATEETIDDGEMRDSDQR